MKKKILLILAACLLAGTFSPYCAAQGDKEEDHVLDSGKRVETWMHIILPSYVGVAMLPETNAFGPYLAMDVMGVRFSSRASRLEADLAARFSYIHFKLADGKINAPYVGIPVRVSYTFGKWWKVYAGATGEYLLNNSANRWRASVEGGLSWHGIGLWASYGLTPFFNPSQGTDHTVTVGLIIGL